MTLVEKAQRDQLRPLVWEAIQSGKSYRAVSKEYGVPVTTVCRWSQEYRGIIQEPMYSQLASLQAAQKPLAAPSSGLNLDGDDSDVLDLPHGYKEVHEPYKLKGQKIGVISDVHVPSHDKYATEAALRYMKGIGIDTLLINGDFMDFYQISDHDKDKTRSITFGDELEEGRLILSQIRAYLGPHVDIVYQEGNHEERYKRFLPQAMAGDKVRGSSVREQLDLDKYDVTWVGDRRGIECGKLTIYHGHEMRASGVNAARNLINRMMDNVLIGHLHRPQSVQRPRLKGDSIGAWVSGCLCDLRPHYFPINEWQHAFNIVHVEDNGIFRVESKLILNGKVL
jgi:predicted phosphodiesterase